MAEYRTAAPAPSPPMTVEERMRTDPLMMPQKAMYLDDLLPMSKGAIVVGKDVEKPAVMIEIRQGRLTRYGGIGTVTDAPDADTTAIISLGDTAWAKRVEDLASGLDGARKFHRHCQYGQ